MTPFGICTRFAPSPTGFLHIGGVRTALYSWLWARRHGGKFRLRIEDTDKQRESQAAVHAIIEAMRWLGLEHDGEIVFQSERAQAHRDAIDRLLRADRAYWCHCSPEELDAMRKKAMAEGLKPRYDGRCRDAGHPAPEGAGAAAVVRFKRPLQECVRIADLVQGEVAYDSGELDDLVLMRANGMPTYNLAVVVDDADMGITHVVRGDDHLNNAPRQLQLFRALDLKPPVFAHLPMILDVDGKKLSKRSGAADALEWRHAGFLPDAVLNYLLRLGWSHGDEEIFPRQRMMDAFDLAGVNKSAARLNPDKLLWLNKQYLAGADAAGLEGEARAMLEDEGLDPSDGPELRELIEVQKKRTATLREMARQSACFYREFGDYDGKAASKHLRSPMLPALQSLRAACAELSDWERGPLRACIEDCAVRQSLKFGKLAQAVRVAVTGAAVSPSLEDTLFLLGRAKTLHRLERAMRGIEEGCFVAAPEAKA